jgi:anthranilate synthase component 2/para-aminobenzoate synthetase component 2
VHGKISRIYHNGLGVFDGLPQGFAAARYHSLVVDRIELPDELEITAQSDDGEIMGLRHRQYPIEGIQFHPESILTPLGKPLLQNFLVAPAKEREEVIRS